MARRILEIGPGIRPMHHRSQEGLRLDDDEQYIGVDQSEVIFQNPAWQKIKEQFGDRAQIFRGNRNELSMIEDGSIDELVALGTSGDPAETLSEISRVIRTGGSFVLGMSQMFASGQHGQEWQTALEQIGFEHDPQGRLDYSYFPVADAPDRPYTVKVFRKR